MAAPVPQLLAAAAAVAVEAAVVEAVAEVAAMLCFPAYSVAEGEEAAVVEEISVWWRRLSHELLAPAPTTTGHPITVLS